GAGQGGLAWSARPQDQQERAAALRCSHKPPPGLIDPPVAAEEYCRMFGLERCQPSKRRTLLLRPSYPRTKETTRLKPLPQQQLDLLLECIRAEEILKRGLELTLLRPEPFAPECLERVELGLRLPAALHVRHWQGGIGSLAEHIDIWHAPRLRSLEGYEQLVGRPRRIGLPVWHAGESAGSSVPMRVQKIDTTMSLATASGIWGWKLLSAV